MVFVDIKKSRIQTHYVEYSDILTINLIFILKNIY